MGYDDLTAIDWIFEYTKERQRKRLLYASGQGILGHLRQLVDGTDIWLVLVLTGVATAIIAACIDIAANWLADLKIGYCKNSGDGEGFYLNKGFCCWGHEGADRCASGPLACIRLTVIFQTFLIVRAGLHGELPSALSRTEVDM